MSAFAAPTLTPAEVTLTYHARSKHRLDRYAAGPETLDWDAQPNPFREFSGAPRMALPLSADRLGVPFDAFYESEALSPAPLTLDSVSMLLELSFGLSAWKKYGPDRWALRCNPSSGNLHPTEAYVHARALPGLTDGLYHYVSRDHALERRADFAPAPSEKKPRLSLALSSIHWREAWKYGERAFRYCQLDIGHALGALRYAAAALGWQARLVEDADSAALARVMGLDRAQDFAAAEHEDPECLITIEPGPMNGSDRAWADVPTQWRGQANLLDPHPFYRWPIIDEVSAATRGQASDAPCEIPSYPPLEPRFGLTAASIILNRRSAHRFDARFTMNAASFYRLLDALLCRPGTPFDLWDQPPRVHPLLFVHRVEGLEPGLYALPRHPSAELVLRGSLNPDFAWTRTPGAADHLPFFKLQAADCRAVAKTLSCHQTIARDGCFALGLLAEFDPLITTNCWHYRQLHWEAGLLGQVLYLEAEAAGLRGTGIGCFFDDAVHALIGLKSARFQSLYHFTIGRPLIDSRIASLPAYPGRHGPGLEETSP